MMLETLCSNLFLAPQDYLMISNQSFLDLYHLNAKQIDTLSRANLAFRE